METEEHLAKALLYIAFNPVEAGLCVHPRDWRWSSFYGVEETESLCRDPALARSDVIRTSGGHHFDGNYVVLAERILEGARRRMAAAG